MTLHTDDTAHSPRGLAAGRLNSISIAFMVLGVAAPIGAITGPAILGVALGNGPGMVGTYVVVTLLLIVFSFGYAAITQYVRQTGAFYSYVQLGLGKIAGGAAAFIALLTYTAAFCTVAGAAGFFGSMLLDVVFGLAVPWWVISFAALIVVGVLGRAKVDISTRVLIGLLVVELLFFLVLNVGIIANSGLSSFSLEVFSPAVVFGQGFPIAVMFAIFTFAGVEVAAIYSEESRQGGKTVRKATFLAIGFIGLFYVVTMWCLLSALDGGAAIAAEAPGDFAFIVASEILGPWGGNALLFLVVISLFASMVAIHQSVSRYMLALSRDGLLPSKFAEIRAKTKAPANASLAHAVVCGVIIIPFVLLNADPLLTLVTSLGGVATVGTLGLWALASVSIVAFFRRRQDSRIWATLLAPAVSALIFAFLWVLTVANYPLVTGVEDPFTNALWWSVPVLAVAGAAYVAVLRLKAPSKYAAIGESADADIDDVLAR